MIDDSKAEEFYIAVKIRSFILLEDLKFPKRKLEYFKQFDTIEEAFKKLDSLFCDDSDYDVFMKKENKWYRCFKNGEIRQVKK